jgi:hypothetical protein
VSAGAQHASRRVRCSSALLDGPPASRDHQRMDPTVRELVLAALLSAFLCGVALIYAEPIATAVFAALTSGAWSSLRGSRAAHGLEGLARFAQSLGSPHVARRDLTKSRRNSGAAGRA